MQRPRGRGGRPSRGQGELGEEPPGHSSRGQKDTCMQDGGHPASWPERGPQEGGEEGLARRSHPESLGKGANSSLSEGFVHRLMRIF